MTQSIRFNADGTRTITEDGLPDFVPPVDVVAEIATLKTAAVVIAQRVAPLTKAEAEALVKASQLESKG